MSNATIREDIVGFFRFEKDKYDEFVEAAMLRHDLDVLLSRKGTMAKSALTASPCAAARNMESAWQKPLTMVPKL